MARPGAHRIRIATTVEQVWFDSKDGTRVPMFLGYRKGLKLDGTNPTLLTGYGGFNLSQRPSFSARGAVDGVGWRVRAWPICGAATSSVRPGTAPGMLANKQNVFDDFIAAAEWLIRNRYTARERLAIWGRSNGGLLMGAALTQRPDLLRAPWCAATRCWT